MVKKKVSQECKLTVGSFTKQLLEMKKKNGGGNPPQHFFLKIKQQSIGAHIKKKITKIQQTDKHDGLF